MFKSIQKFFGFAEKEPTKPMYVNVQMYKLNGIPVPSNDALEIMLIIHQWSLMRSRISYAIHPSGHPYLYDVHYHMLPDHLKIYFEEITVTVETW